MTGTRRKGREMLRCRTKRRVLLAVTVNCMLVCVGSVMHAGGARAEENSGAGWRFATGPIVGVGMLDPRLADYRWDTRPAMQTGARATVYRGRFGAGLRVLRSRTSQSTGITGVSEAPRVNLTAVDIVASVRVAGYRGVELWGVAQSGVLHLGYDPDRLTFDPGVGTPVTVSYDPISEWDLGLGIEVRRELIEHMALSLQAEGSTFALDTAHRRGGEIVESRERFYGWSLRMQVSWLFGQSWTADRDSSGAALERQRTGS